MVPYSYIATVAHRITMSDRWKTRTIVPKQPRAADGSAPGWYSREYLPHFDGGETPQMVTFNLNDALPQRLLQEWSKALAHRPKREVRNAKAHSSLSGSGCGLGLDEGASDRQNGSGLVALLRRYSVPATCLGCDAKPRTCSAGATRRMGA